MNIEKVKQEVLTKIPKIEHQVIEDTSRHNMIDSPNGTSNIGIELGVASGIYSSHMINSGKSSTFFGVDVYGDIHNTEQCQDALRRVGPLENYKPLRMTFDEAAGLFEDNFFDFIYIDGYAHAGEEGGETLLNWCKKLKPNGVMADDDYLYDWPLVQWAANDFTRQLNTPLPLTDKTDDTPYSNYPSWLSIKGDNPEVELTPSKDLQTTRLIKKPIHTVRTKTLLYNGAAQALDFLEI